MQAPRHDLQWTRLDWDSEFFGFGIGRVTLDGATLEMISQVEAEARSEGIVCLYGDLDPVHRDLIVPLQGIGFSFIEASFRFDLDLDRAVDAPSEGIAVRRATEQDLPLLEDAVVRLAPWSRYALDPRFGLDAARRMNVAWVERAARSRSDDRRLMVAESDDRIRAFMCSARQPGPFVDTVGTTAPGSGAARALMQEAREWGGSTLGCGWAAVRNVNSTRFVENCGFQVAKVRYVYHRWLDEG